METNELKLKLIEACTLISDIYYLEKRIKEFTENYSHVNPNTIQQFTKENLQQAEELDIVLTQLFEHYMHTWKNNGGN